MAAGGLGNSPLPRARGGDGGLGDSPLPRVSNHVLLTVCADTLYIARGIFHVPMLVCVRARPPTIYMPQRPMVA